MLAAAFFRAIGVQCFPIEKHSKKPIISWSNQATCDRFPVENFQNIAFRCGQAHPDGGFVVVLDFDNPATHSEAKKPPFPLLYACLQTGTLTIQTPGGGLHFYFRVDEPVGIMDFEWGELRGAGGYVLMPFSKIYIGKWDEVRPYRVLQGSLVDFWGSIKVMPDEVVAMLQSSPSFLLSPGLPNYPPVSQSPASDPPSPQTTPPQVQEIEIFSSEVESILKILSEGVGESEYVCENVKGRNDAVFHLAYQLAKKQLHPEHVTAICLLANKQFRPPLPEREVYTAIRSALKRAEELKKVTGHSDNGNGHKSNGFDPTKGRVISAKELMNMHFEEPVPLISDVLFKGTRNLVCSPTGVGKSTLVMHWAAQMAQAGLRVAFLEMEMDKRTTQRYYRMLGLPEDVAVDFLFELEALEHLERADVIIVDSVRSYFSGLDINKAELVETALNHLWDTIQRKYHTDTLILIHHTNKLVYNLTNIDLYNPAGFVQGSERFLSWPDTVLYVSRHPESSEFSIHVLKTRLGEYKTWKTKVELRKKGAEIEFVH